MLGQLVSLLTAWQLAVLLAPKERSKSCICVCWLLLEKICSSLGNLLLERLGLLPPTFRVPQHKSLNFHLKVGGEWLLLVIFHCGFETSAKINLCTSSGRMNDFSPKNVKRNIFSQFFTCNSWLF